jgi:dephospho-CoA kinase
VNELKLIVFVGMPGAGKSVCVEYLIDNGLPSVYFGGITIDEVKARGLEVNERNEKIVREEIRANEGDDAYAHKVIERINEIENQGHSRVVVDGLYSWTEYKIFKEKYGDNAVIVAVAAPRHLRHSRLFDRSIRPLNDKEVTSREYAEIENLEKGGPIANADYTIVNDASKEHLITELDKILKKTDF